MNNPDWNFEPPDFECEKCGLTDYDECRCTDPYESDTLDEYLAEQ